MCARGDQRDWDYAKAALDHGLLDTGELRRRVPPLSLDAERRDESDRMLQAIG